MGRARQKNGSEKISPRRSQHIELAWARDYSAPFSAEKARHSREGGNDEQEAELFARGGAAQGRKRYRDIVCGRRPVADRNPQHRAPTPGRAAHPRTAVLKQALHGAAGGVVVAACR